MLNDPLGFGVHGLAAGRFSRAASGSDGRPSLRGSLLPSPLPPECCLSTNGLGCGRGRHRFDAQSTIWVCSSCRRAVCESRGCTNFGSAPRFRIALWLITPGYAIDRVARAGSAVAMALACGAFLGCHVMFDAYVRGASCGGVPEGDFAEFSRPPQSFPEHDRHGFELPVGMSNYLPSGLFF